MSISTGIMLRSETKPYKTFNAKQLAKFANSISTSTDPTLKSLARKLRTEVCTPLLLAFEEDSVLLNNLVEYAKNEVCRRQLSLMGCPDIPSAFVINAIVYLASNNEALDDIRESGDLVVFRIIIELLHRLGFLNLQRDDTDTRRAACSLVDVILVNIANPQLYPGHVFLFTRALRSLVSQKKLPMPSSTRMQQAEYLLDPLTRIWYLSCEGYIKQPSRTFHEALSEKLMAKFLALQGDPVERQFDIGSKARVFEILTRIIERLFGVSPYLFGSGASGLATAASDMDVVVIQPRQEIRNILWTSQLWKNSGQPDFCPFPSMARVRARRPKSKKLNTNGKVDKNGKIGKKERGPVCTMERRSNLGKWKWLSRPPPEVAAIWAGRILARRLARFGWRVECVETARVPILRIVAAVNDQGEPIRVPEVPEAPKSAVPKSLKSDVPKPPPIDGEKSSELIEKEEKKEDELKYKRKEKKEDEMKDKKKEKKEDEMKDEKKEKKENEMKDDKKEEKREKKKGILPKLTLDPILAIGKTRDWDGCVPDPNTPGAMKHISKLTSKEKAQLNLYLQNQFDSRLARDINCPVENWDSLLRCPVSLDKSSAPAPTKSTEKDIHLIHLDISFNHEIVVHNTRLMKSYAECDPMLPMLGILVKHWAKQRGICDSYNGTLSGYQWMLLVIHFLQHFLLPSPGNNWLPVLPNLQNPPSEFDGKKTQIVDGRHNAFFFHPFRGPNRMLSPEVVTHSGFPSPSSSSSNHPTLQTCSHQPTSQTLSGSNALEERVAMAAPIDLLSSDWPEDVFKDRPFDYALHLLTPIDCEELKRLRSDPKSQKHMEMLKRMKKYSTPDIEFSKNDSKKKSTISQSTGTVLPARELNWDRYPFVMKSDFDFLSSSICGFFEYFGMRFNCHTHIIGINRTPKLPQRKSDFFIFKGSTGSADNCDVTENLNFDVKSTPLAPPKTPDECRSPEGPSSPRNMRNSVDHEIQRTLSQNQGMDLLHGYVWDSMGFGETDDLSDVESVVEEERPEIEDQIEELSSTAHVLLDSSIEEQLCSPSSGESDDELDSDDSDEVQLIPTLDPWSVLWASPSDPDSNGERRASYLRRRDEMIAADIQASRNSSSFRQRQSYCVLDPFEENRTIGPARRDGFTQMVFEFLRARCLILDAEYHYEKGDRTIDFSHLVEKIFEKSEPTGGSHHPYSAGPYTKDSPYYHLKLEDYDSRDYEVPSLKTILHQIHAQQKRERDFVLRLEPKDKWAASKPTTQFKSTTKQPEETKTLQSKVLPTSGPVSRENFIKYRPKVTQKDIGIRMESIEKVEVKGEETQTSGDKKLSEKHNKEDSDLQNGVKKSSSACSERRERQNGKLQQSQQPPQQPPQQPSQEQSQQPSQQPQQLQSKLSKPPSQAQGKIQKVPVVPSTLAPFSQRDKKIKYTKKLDESTTTKPEEKTRKPTDEERLTRAQKSSRSVYVPKQTNAERP